MKISAASVEAVNGAVRVARGLLALIVSSLSVHGTGEPVKLESLKTLAGKEYRKITISKKNERGIGIIHEGGAAWLPIERLKEEDLTALGLPTKKQREEEEHERIEALRAELLEFDKELAKTAARAQRRWKLEELCRKIARREYPEDLEMQKFVFENQWEALRYMQSDDLDEEVRGVALGDYPEDYVMQKFTYDSQIVAKRYMAAAKDKEVRAIAKAEYPADYTMQKHVYEQQTIARRYMASRPDDFIKRAAAKEFPRDYVTQKLLYNRAKAAVK